ncbi:hypothetical protein, conserved [Plasmodium gonderi]|uniref:S5 DRBM domain-containing protein n=1 Tax=Plasmodium gonderi TaxID=77519 RepID=A0A1Y1JU47_PLAGO|nr:hypothetical protein, conserved [Plasmodium gonderi]GAW83424.1 hypothetical protein, conserved [Plasmodium gonderi]
MLKNVLGKRKYCNRFLRLNTRSVHNSHLNKTLKNRYNEKVRDKYLDNIYNNEININSITKNVKNKKINYLRQLIYDEADGDEYLLDENILEEIKRKKYKSIRQGNTNSSRISSKERNEEEERGEIDAIHERSKQEMSESKYKQAIRMYNLLKLTEKSNIFDEDVFMNIDSKMNHDIFEFAQKNILHDDNKEMTHNGSNEANNIINGKIIDDEKNTSSSSICGIPASSSPGENKADIFSNTTVGSDPSHSAVKINDSNFMNITKMNLPVFNPSSFCLAIESLTNHICDDLIYLFGDLLEEKNIPLKTENDRLYKFINNLCEFFSFEKNESDVERWMKDVYKKVKTKLPRTFRNIKDEYVENWIKEHIRRVLVNQKCNNQMLYKEKYYNLGNDFIYDNLPVNINNEVDDKIDYSTDKLTYYFKTIIEFFMEKKIDANLEEQLNMMFLNLKKIGLNNWLKMDIKDFEKYLLRNKNCNFLEINENDKYTSYLMLKCASRNITDFFFYEEFSPFYLFNEKPKFSIEEKINSMQPNKHISDDELKKMIYSDNSSVTIVNNNNHGDRYHDMDIDLFLEKEKKYNMNRSLITYSFDETTDSYSYKYKQIPNTIYDHNTNKYIREKETIDPMLKLNEMRSSILEVKRMMSMTKDGRVYYIRIIIIIGNGKGVYGYGVGFGKNIKEARNSALLNSISNIDFIDYNYKNCILNFPVSGQEYSSHVKIIPRPLGRGLKINRKYLPLGYILGLDNVKISFSGSNKWMSRIKALKRCLNKIISIKTLCKMTGKKYVCHFAPHYCTSHWPDYWFKNILKEYKYKIQRIQKKRSIVCRKNFRSNISKIPEEVRPDFTPYAWKTPIQKYVESHKLKKYIDNNIYHNNLF